MALKSLSLLPYSVYNANISFDEKHQLEQQLLLDRLNQLKQRQFNQQEELLKLQKEQLELEDVDNDYKVQNICDIINDDNESNNNDISNIELFNSFNLSNISELICNSISNSIIYEVASCIEESNKDHELKLPNVIDSNIQDKCLTKDIQYTDYKQSTKNKFPKEISDERPIKSIFNKIQNYDVFVEKEIAINGKANNENSQNKISKKPFLKKGHGLAKYYNKNSNLKTEEKCNKSKSNNSNMEMKKKLINVEASINNNKLTEISLAPKLNPLFSPPFIPNTNSNLNSLIDLKLLPNHDKELEEFEILESALDNSSFCSNLSTISKIVAHHKIKFQNSNHFISNTDSNKNITIEPTKYIFNDEETWDSYTNVDESDSKIDDSKAFNNSNSIDQTPKDSFPPVSKLISKFFPVIESNNKKQTLSNSSNNSDIKSVVKSNQNKINHVVIKEKKTGDDMHLQTLKDRIMELESEIKIYKDENAALLEIKKGYFQQVDQLKNERLLFENQKLEEAEKFESYKNDQNKKLLKEKKIFEAYQKSTKDQLTRKEREEIDLLKGKILKLKETYASKEQKLTFSNKRLKDRILQLEVDNEHLRNDILLLEKTRISNNKKQESCKLSNFNGKINLNLSEPCIQVLKNGPNSPKYNMIDNTNLHFSNPTLNEENDNEEKYNEIVHSDGRIEHINIDGSRQIFYTNGTKKDIFPDGVSSVVTFFNGDIKKVYPDHRIMYYYAESKTKHTTYSNGLEVFEFPNEQVEKHFPNGKKEIIFPDKTIKYVYPDGSEESVLENGTVIRILINGDKIMEYPNGQKEIHNKDYKRREYPNGTVKTIYPDGRQETHYPTGRLRIKDKDGVLIVDTCI